MTVAEKCEKEKKALDNATKERDKAEGRLEYWNERIGGWEAEAERALGSANSDCTKPLWHGPSAGGMRWHTEGEYWLDEECVIDRWVYASKLLEAAREFRSGSVYIDYLGRFEIMQDEEERRKAAYCACVNGETPP
jgi:hypothetical protein